MVMFNRLEMDMSNNDLSAFHFLAAARNFWIIYSNVGQIEINGNLSHKIRNLVRYIQFLKALRG